VALENHCRQKLEQVSQDIQKLDPDGISLSAWSEEEG
jgi:exonuclease VII small subunit